MVLIVLAFYLIFDDPSFPAVVVSMMVSLWAKPEARQATVLRAFVSEGERQLTVAVGDKVAVITEHETGWDYVRMEETGVEGWIPHSSFREKRTQKKTEDSADAIIAELEALADGDRKEKETESATSDDEDASVRQRLAAAADSSSVDQLAAAVASAEAALEAKQGDGEAAEEEVAAVNEAREELQEKQQQARLLQAKLDEAMCLGDAAELRAAPD